MTDQDSFSRQLTYFASDVGLSVALEQGGRITSIEAYRRIKRRWRLLRDMYRELKDGTNPDGC